MLHPPPEQLRRSGGQRPRHQENAERGREGPRESSGPVAQKGCSNEHRTWGDIAEGYSRGKILGTGPPSLSDRNPLDERQRRRATPKSQEADEHTSHEQVEYHGVSSWSSCPL